MPTPQENLLFVEQASCLFLTKLRAGKMPTPQEEFTLCGTGILPVLDKAATSEQKNISKRG